MLAEDWEGRVRVWDLRRSVRATRLPTGEIRRVLLEITVLPPLYGAPRRLWNLKFMAEMREREREWGGCGARR